MNAPEGRRVLFLGGNGHCEARLLPARNALRALAARGEAAPLEIVDVAYPGFEGRPRALSLEAFLDAVEDQVAAGATLAYATGIGGLIALCLRGRARVLNLPILLQAPVLWGLERRLLPRLMRVGPARSRVHRVFASPAFRGWFLRRHLQERVSPELRAAFFDGYARCAALPDLFSWLTPGLLRSLVARFAERREALEGIAVWWGARDRVVTPRELERTEKALRVKWPLRTFAAWGHYPMIEDGGGWVRALAEALAQPPLTGGMKATSSPSARGVSKGA